MTHPAITVENLSKVYRLGVKEEAPDTLASAFTGVFRSPLRNLQRLRRLSRFNEDDDGADTLWALKDVSFEVAEGEVLGVIGRNGAGKSTLLKILSRITEPTSGRAVIRGRVSSLLEVGTGFHPELTGRDNIYMNGTILGMTKREIDRKFDEIVDFSGVERFLDTPIKRYSSGMNVRLAFAVAAHLEPEILIIDEVLAVGDVSFQKKCIGKMRDVAGSGRTVLFVSHNMAALQSICSRAIELRDGAIQVTGEVDKVIESYRSHAYSQLGNTSTAGLAALSKFFGRIELLDGKNKPLQYAEIGKEIRIRLQLKPPRRLVDARVRIGFDDMMGRRLFTVQTPATSDELCEVEGATSVVCRIPEIPLAPGAYTINVSLAENREILEEISSALSIEVENAEIFGEGRGFSVGLFAVRSHWQVMSEGGLASSVASDH